MIMKFIIISLLPLVAFCQTTDNETSKFLVGFVFSPDYCYRFLKPDSDEKWVAEDRDLMEIPKFGFTTGASLLFKHSEHLTLETGLLYSDKGYKTKFYANFIYNTSDPSIPTSIKYIYHYHYLDIPIKANYNLFSKKFKFFISGGISVNVFLGQKTLDIYEFSDGHSEERSWSYGMHSASPINIAVLLV